MKLKEQNLRIRNIRVREIRCQSADPKNAPDLCRQSAYSSAQL